MPNPSTTMTTTMGQMADQLKLHTKLQNYFGIGGVTGEPMGFIANRVMQMLLTKRMPWRFNQLEFAPFPYGTGNFMVSQAGFQQIQFAGASVFVLLPQTGTNPISPNLPVGGVGIDLAATVWPTGGNFTYYPQNGGTNSVVIDPTTGIITVQTLDPHPFQTVNLSGPQAYLTGLTNPAFNSVYTFNTTLSTALWTQGYNFNAIVDQYHFTLQGTLGEHYASLTNISATAGVITVTVANTMSQGDIMMFSNIATNSALNGKTVTLLTATATTVTFTTPTGVTITNGADTGYIYAAPSGAPGIFTASWLQASDVYDLNSTAFPMPVDQVKAVHRKAKEYSVTGDRMEIAIQKDGQNGVLTFRLTEPLATYPYAFSLTIQQRAPKMTKAQDVFPWPDELSYVILDMCLWLAMRMSYGVSNAETMAQAQYAQASLQMALESEDREDNTMALSPDLSFMS